MVVKHHRVTAVSLAAALSPVAGIAAWLAGPLPATGGEVPFNEHVLSDTADGPRSVFAADLDGDGDLDILTASEFDNKIAWYQSNGGLPVTFTDEIVISTAAIGAWSVFAMDVDGDGDTDVLSASDGDNKIAWYENDGALFPTFTERVISTDALGAHSVFAADLDGDGDTDVLSGSLSDTKVAWYENDGQSPPTFTEHVLSTDTTAFGSRSVLATDLDGDGDIDVLSTSFAGEIAWYENDGGSPPTFTERVISTTASGGSGLCATDLDGDGNIDVLSAAARIAWYESDGGSPPTFTERVIVSDVGFALSVFAADVDNDGDIDVLSATFGHNNLVWYESSGGAPPTWQERVISTDSNLGFSVFAVDLDGDADPEILHVGDTLGGSKLMWYENVMQHADLDADGDVDLHDFALLQLAFTGPK